MPSFHLRRPTLSIVLVATALILGGIQALRAAPSWNVLDAGAVPDGQADNTTVFQHVLDEAGRAGGGVVEVPAGRYRFNAGLTIPANVCLQGIYRVPPTSAPNTMTNVTGSVLFAYAGRGSTEGPPFVRLAGNNAAVAGLIIAYPEWKQADVPPVPYPPCIMSQNTENVGIRNCLLLNPYEGIRLVRAHRHLVRNVTGYPIRRGLFVDECYDIGHIENVHFWPFGVRYDPNDPFCKWVNTEGVAFELARTDWHYVHNTFCFGYGIGYKFSKSAHGSANGNFLGLGADSCQRAVVVEGAQPPGLLITNGEFVGRWSSTNAVCLEVVPGVEGKVSLVNCSFWGPIDRCVWMRSAAGQFTANACHFVQWDVGGSGSPAVQLDAGRASIVGCTFNEENLHISVSSNVVSAILTANQAPGGLDVRNQAGRRTQMALNEVDAIDWTPEALAHYQVQIGAPGDGRYIRGWHGPERGPQPFRWSKPRSRLNLPVTPGIPYTLRLEARCPDAALGPESGLYLNDQRVASFNNGTLLTVDLPPCSEHRQHLDLRVLGWIPKDNVPDSQDARTLGIQGFSVIMRASDAGTRLFDANTGQWLDPDR